MLPSCYRLLKKSDFEKVKKEGRLLTGKLLGILFTLNQQESSRFGLIVSKKISKKTVERNRVKRRLREAIRPLLPKIVSGFDMLVLAKKGILEASTKQIFEELEKLLKKGGLLK